MSAGRPRIGVNVDPRADRFQDALEVAGVADRAGVDMISLQDHPYLGDHLDTWTLAVALAMRTHRVRVLTNVASVHLRRPQILAKSGATLSLLSAGRVLLGVGAGASPDRIAGYGGPHLDAGASVDALDEAIRVMRSLWEDRREVSVAGEHHRLERAEPGPVPRRPIPVWVGAYGPRMLALTGRLGDGWTPSNAYAPPSQVAEMQKQVDVAAERAGRDTAEVQRNYNVFGRIDERQNTETAERLVGPPELWIDEIGRYQRELGMDSVVFWPVGDDHPRQVRRFVEEVLPELASSGPAG